MRPVSYTHLDVYKRQECYGTIFTSVEAFRTNFLFFNLILLWYGGECLGFILFSKIIYKSFFNPRVLQLMKCLSCKPKRSTAVSYTHLYSMRSLQFPRIRAARLCFCSVCCGVVNLSWAWSATVDPTSFCCVMLGVLLLSCSWRRVDVLLNCSYLLLWLGLVTWPVLTYFSIIKLWN